MNTDENRGAPLRQSEESHQRAFTRSIRVHPWLNFGF